jgi:hypothetical protein
VPIIAKALLVAGGLAVDQAIEKRIRAHLQDRHRAITGRAADRYPDLVNV